MVKTRVSITIDEGLDKKIDKLLKDSIYRNKSHLAEVALQEFVKKRKER